MINREKRVRRHNPSLSMPDIRNPFQLGNGNFAFGADITGLQTFENEYNRGLPLSTMSHTLWHSHPEPPGYTYSEYPRLEINHHGRKSRYLAPPDGPNRAHAEYLRRNPHRLNLGRVFFHAEGLDGFDDLKDVRQELDLWTGILSSSFTFRGAPVRVRTAVAAELDELGVIIESPLLTDGTLRVRLAFPYGQAEYGGNNADWNHPLNHQTVFEPMDGGALFHRTLDETSYQVRLKTDSGVIARPGEHEFEITASGPILEIGVLFNGGELPFSASKVLDSSRRGWGGFWNSGGCLEVADGPTEQAAELEHRVVLSEYLTRINCSGPLPPAETGLACNSWSGRFHLEMHWWHGVHFGLWDRPELLFRSMDFYRRLLPLARSIAAEQGFAGARWPKSAGPAGYPVPSPIEPWLVWHLPHPIYYAELFYRRRRSPEILDYFAGIVDETAAFLADFLHQEADGRCQLGPPLLDAAEAYRDPFEVYNPTFETAYFRWALEIAQRWRERRRLARHTRIDRILSRMPEPQAVNGRYTAGEFAPDPFTPNGKNYSHPAMLAICGMLPGRDIDPAIMRNTLNAVLTHWDWNRESWGWDYPLAALTAIRLGEPETAIDILLMDTPANRYLLNGHNYQNAALPCYLPGNGGLLTATAMLALRPAPQGWRFRRERLSGLL